METRIFPSLNGALSALFGSEVKIARRERIAGGDINDAYGLTLTDGTRIFMKSNKKENASFFDAEAEGLMAIARAETIGTPGILGRGTDDASGSSFLLLEFVDGKGRVPDFWEEFAHQLAAMHRAPTGDFVDGGKYGFFRDNYIGARKQVNTACGSWAEFFRECRLRPQLHQAEHYFDRADRKKVEGLLAKVDDILPEPERPSLLHGDLWSGNFMTGNDGRAWLIDPASYVGNAEADIAMTELFGGFSAIFYDAYRESGLLRPGYEGRRDLYNLYHLLNHLNMFGRAYLSSVRRIVGRYG